jgi:hypothetical protein
VGGELLGGREGAEREKSEFGGAISHETPPLGRFPGEIIRTFRDLAHFAPS